MNKTDTLIDRLRELAGKGTEISRTLTQAADALENQQLQIRAQQDVVAKQQATIAGLTVAYDAAVETINSIAKSGRVWMCPYCEHRSEILGGGICVCELGIGVCKMPYTQFEWSGAKGGAE